MSNNESRVVAIADKIDREATKEIVVSGRRGGVQFQNMLEVMEGAKLLAISGPAVPKWLQGNPGGCWAVIMQAVEWDMSPVQVARMSYEVNGVVAYMSQLVHAVVEARAPLSEPLECVYDGEGPTRTCKVVGKLMTKLGREVIREYTSPMFKDINPKNSPLWKNDPDQQLWYFGSRSWARKWCPHVLMGIYSRDEIEDNPHIGAENARDVSPPAAALTERLKAAHGGVQHTTDHVEKEMNGDAGEPAAALTERLNDVQEAPADEPKADKPAKKTKAPKAEAKKPVAVPEVPRNAEEYLLYAKHWMDEWDGNADDLAAMFNSKKERNLRAICGVVDAEMTAVKAYRDDKLAALAG